MQLPKFTQNLTYVMPEGSRVFIPQELRTQAYNKIAKNVEMLEQAAAKADKNIYFVPKKDNVLMSFGPYTTLIDVALKDSDVLQQLNEIIRKTYKTL